MEKIKNITFKQFIANYNFRSLDKESTSTNSEDCYDTQTIRIYIDDTNWFDFGIYDFGTTENKIMTIEQIFSKDILNSYIDQISTKEYSTYSVIEIYLTNKEVGL